MTKFCPKCGNSAEDDANFCNSCGHKIPIISDENNRNVEQEQSNVSQNQKNMVPPPPPQNNIQNQHTPPPPPNNQPGAISPNVFPSQKPRGKLIAGIISLVAVIAVIFVVILLISGNGLEGTVFSDDEELTGKDKAKDIVKDFLDAYKNENWKKVFSMQMNPDGSFPNQDEINKETSQASEYTNTTVDSMYYKILNVEKLDYTAKHTDEVYSVSFEFSFTITDTDTGETRTQNKSEDIFYVAKNGDKWGLRTSSFDWILDEDQYENDDDSSNATVLQPSSSQTHSIHETSDADWYKFTLTSGKNVKIYLSGDEEYDTEMHLYDSSVSELEYNDDRDDGSLWSAIETTLSAGTYYVKVNSLSMDETISSYNIELTIS